MTLSDNGDIERYRLAITLTRGKYGESIWLSDVVQVDIRVQDRARLEALFARLIEAARIGALSID